MDQVREVSAATQKQALNALRPRFLEQRRKRIFFPITAMRQIWSLALACLTKLTILTKLEIRPAFTEYFI